MSEKSKRKSRQKCLVVTPHNQQSGSADGASNLSRQGLEGTLGGTSTFAPFHGKVMLPWGSPHIEHPGWPVVELRFLDYC